MNEIDPGDGYRLLQKNVDRFAVGDESFTAWGASWSVISTDRVGAIYESGIPVRRKIEDRWIPMSEKLPNGFPCEVWQKGWRGVACDDGKVLATNCNGLRCDLPLRDFTHWKSLNLSDPPEPELPPEEKAFDTFRLNRGLSLSDFGMYREIWHTAIAWERGRKK